MQRIIPILIVWMCHFFPIFSQTDSLKAPTTPNPNAPRISTEAVGNLPVDPPRRFSLVFTRSFLLGNGPDTVSINGGGSGTFSIGGGIKVPLVKETLGLRITPGVSWTSYQYDQTERKTFPTIPDSLKYDLTQEKHRLTTLDMGLGVYINLSKDEDDDPKFYAELGGYAGFLMGASYKTKYTNGTGQRVRERVRDLEKVSEEFERFRYGIYARLGYKWAALHFSYRLTDVFDEFTNDFLKPKDVDGFKNPKIPPIEFGISIFL